MKGTTSFVYSFMLNEILCDCEIKLLQLFNVKIFVQYQGSDARQKILHGKLRKHITSI